MGGCGQPGKRDVCAKSRRFRRCRGDGQVADSYRWSPDWRQERSALERLRILLLYAEHLSELHRPCRAMRKQCKVKHISS